MNASESKDTDEYPVSASPNELVAPQSNSAAIQVDLAALSHRGNVRPNNEDHFLVVRFQRAMQTVLTNLPDGTIPVRVEEVGYGMVVADGMGGMAAGEIASQSAIRALINLALATPDWIMKQGKPEIQRVMQRMSERYQLVDAALREEAQDNVRLSGMGTTMTLACNIGSDLVLSHIGDSRAYLMRNDQLHQLTRDHTLLQELTDRGVVHPDHAASHPFRHVLTRCLGGDESGLKADLHRVSLSDADQLLLCTDGLTEMVDETTIGDILRSAASADEACQTLLSLALENGGKDNVTLIVARYRIPSQPASR